MRCNNCGWDNPKNILRCEKCNYPLDGSLNLFEKQQADTSNENEQKTVRGLKAEQAPWDVSIVSAQSSEKNTPSGDSSVSSGAVLSHFHAQSKEPADISKTINPFHQVPKEEPNAGPTIRIRKVDQTTGKDAVVSEVKAEDDKLKINRKLIDDSNTTISQNEHAKLYFVEGKCFVKNSNPHGATFIRVGDLTEVKKGDCLLVGNELIIIDWD